MPGAVRNMHTEESAEVEVLLANMEKLKGLSKKLNKSVMTLDDGGKGINSSTRPIYGNTGRLQVASGHMDGLRGAMGRLQEEREKQRREGGVIKEGISNVPLTEYTAALDRTAAAISSMRGNPTNNQRQLAELHELLKKGSRELNSLFTDTLRQESKPIEPLTYVLKNQPFPELSSEATSTLRHVSTYMLTTTTPHFRSQSGEPHTTELYPQTRSAYIASTLSNLASASISTARKTDPTALYRPSQSGIGQYTKALESLFASEHSSIAAIFARDHWHPVHTRTVRPAMEAFASTLRDLNEHIKRHPITDAYLAFEIVDLLSRLSVRLDATNPALKPQIHDALRPIRSTASRAVSDLLADAQTRINTLSSLNPDASPLPLCNDIIARLQNCTNFITPLGSLLSSSEYARPPPSASGTTAPRSGLSGDTLVPSTQDGAPLDIGTDSETLFSSYLSHTLETVLTTLDTKSRTLLKSKAAQAVFLANNICILERGLTSPSFSLIPMQGPRNVLGKWRKRGAKAYVDTWADLARNLQDQFHTKTSGGGGGRPPSGSAVDSSAFVKGLSSKERDNIKERFRNFNTGLEEMVSRHKGFRIESEVRSEVSREIGEFIGPYYERFWDRYHEIDKGKGKNVRFDKGQLGQLLAGL